MRKKKHNPDVYMVDVFYEKNQKRTKPNEDNPKKVRNVGIILKMVIIIAVLVLIAGFLPARLIPPEQSETGHNVLINSAPDAKPIEVDGSIPEEAVWRENISPIDIEKRIYLAWDDPTNKNWTLAELPPSINVLSPVWFKLDFAPDGKTVDLANADESTTAFTYVEICHDNGIEVWGCVQCINYELSEVIVKDAVEQQKLIDQILVWMNTYDLDGINIDFEDMNTESTHLFNNFCANLKAAMPEDKVFSVCVNYIYNEDGGEGAEGNTWQAYDRAGLSEIADYIAVMAYGEHKESSDKKPVASIDWIDLQVRRMLEVTPSEKLILGLPFWGTDYRAEVINPQSLIVSPIWQKSGHTTTVFQLNRLLETGRYDYKGTEIVLDYWINKGGWDADLGISDYVFVDTAGIQHTIWIDDENSIYQKVRLAEDYNIAGIAIWKLNLGTESMFEAVARVDE